MSKDEIVYQTRPRDGPDAGAIIQGLWSYNDYCVKSIWWQVNNTCEKLGEFMRAMEIIEKNYINKEARNKRYEIKNLFGW